MARQELTLKQRKFIRYYVDCGNFTEAAEKAGYKTTDRKSLCEIGRENLEKLGDRIKPILAAKGLDFFEFTKILREGLNLPSVNPIRHKYLETFGKVADFFAPEKREVTGKGGGPVELKIIFDKKKGNGSNGDSV